MAIALVTVIIVGLPAVGSGAVPAVARVLHSPYSGYVYARTIDYHGPCNTATNPVQPKFNLHTGVARIEERGASNACNSTAPFRDDLADGIATVLLPVHLSTGTHGIVLQWRATITMNWSVYPGRCVPNTNWSGYYECLDETYYNLYFLGGLSDRTNGSTIWASSPGGNASSAPYFGWEVEYQNITYCVPAGCNVYAGTVSNVTATLRANLSLALYLNATTNSSHSYDVFTWAFGVASASIDTWNARSIGGSTSTLFNMATGGNHAILRSITIT